MKLILFNDNKKVVEILEFLKDVKSYGLDEVTWHLGGMGEIKDNYVIVADEINFADVTDAEILIQYKEQVIYSMAKEIEKHRVDFMVFGTLTNAMNDFEEKKAIVLNATTREEIEIAFNEFRNTHF
jgi:hypothetical protein